MPVSAQRIRLLSEQVANQIAAGEVVERPASVVKELVENSLDAKASRLTVEIQAGGRSLIRVTDDGIGMNRDDALLCLERHATSKIQSAEDLTSITTMGFRGEALPSIASVSRMTLSTREVDAAEGTQLTIHGGKILEVKAAGSAPGTVMEVRNLFYNLPARRKFLRSEETEKAHIQHYLTLAAVAHPRVAFTFVQDGRIVWQLPGIKNAEGENALEALKERLRALLSTGLQLVPVNHTGSIQNYQTEEEAVPSHDTMRIWGLIGAPGVSRGNRDEQYVFVNRRPVENRGINFALLEGYHTSLMKGRYPVCALFIEINPASVDVNIHPSKREIKFRQEQAVRKIVADAVKEALLAYHAARQPTPLRTEPLDEPPTSPAPEAPAQTVRSLPSEPIPWPERDAPAAPTLRLRAENPAPPPVEQSNFGWARASPPAAPSVPLLEVPLRLVGVIGKLYVVLESDRGLVLLDQHAAHERILFEQMLRRVEQSGVAPSQGLLLPETIELSIRDAHFLREQMPILVKLGVSLSEFGERTFLLDGLPPFVRKTAPRTFVLELIEALKQAGADVNSWRLGEHTVAKTVCRHAVKANDALSGLELENLVEDLRRCQMPYTCPHGRPTLIEMNFRELEKKFGRTQ